MRRRRGKACWAQVRDISVGLKVKKRDQNKENNERNDKQAAKELNYPESPRRALIWASLVRADRQY